MIGDLLIPSDRKIIMLIMDGLGGLRNDAFPQTALEAASTPNLDRLAANGACGRSLPIAPGITPGSGPAHFALFGYDPLAPENDAGRGATEVTGVGFELKKEDVAIRGNFATINSEGVLTDRRAGRIPHQEGVRICEKLSDNIREIDGIEIIIMPVREYRFGLVLRGDNLNPAVEETDPQVVDMKPLPPRAMNKDAEFTAGIISKFIQRCNEVLSDEEKANTVLMRGISSKPDIQPFKDKFNLDAAAVAFYPLYRGVAGFCGMKLIDTGGYSPGEAFETVRSGYREGFNFFFIHIKKTDSHGEDGNLEKKKEVIEDVDSNLPAILDLKPDVIMVTGDHSTPCALKSHSWHPVPFLIHSDRCGRDRSRAFSEIECDRGSLGVFPAMTIMPRALANAGMLKKFGA
ncbi:MAG: 2,3-bisphosphoglycerate-independent phosphoglycerate mutase [Candidatus Latescibacteria bacterium]|nr:2,3-bisphosphoglycerate-independent phosphoglycerate mutase [bacterium]MBD3423728.1 2,3-bisphosphoglycerate-independent phosphoglycerate mutase [Candidatus Latescibacterota bacterium]